MVGRARFELATNGLKDLRIVSNSNQNINLNLPRNYLDIGDGFCGVDWVGVEVDWFRQCRVGVSGNTILSCRENRQSDVFPFFGKKMDCPDKPGNDETF